MILFYPKNEQLLADVIDIIKHIKLDNTGAFSFIEWESTKVDQTTIEGKRKCMLQTSWDMWRIGSPITDR